MAAGGRGRRFVWLDQDRVALGSVLFRRLKGRRIYAYLRWNQAGRVRERYVGEVDGATRAENLAEAWRLVTERGLRHVPSPDDPAR